ncbi:uncharacterized protein BXZ73DRAFT_81223 [Epithele typhae]|uniref:uncharacterized protein n=1 Tax=Epithele typhae TaxID=378194 RepID=UPI0020086BD4|nr:uncharacterized protein BXZ73DRAFT_81223 [Epithele typhae]KAH9915955.1 hypothetical protein BXZ73DRAFT_81223 [Epithele typhae]
MDKIPQELFRLLLRWIIQRPGLKSSFTHLAEYESNPGFHSWFPLRLVSRRWNETIVSEKHFWSTILASGPHAREWLMLCLVRSDGVPIDVILPLDMWLEHEDTRSFLVEILPHALHLRSLAVIPLNREDRDPLNEFFTSTTFPALTTLVLESDVSNRETRRNTLLPFTFEQRNAPALTTISVNARWQVPRPAIFARLKCVSLTTLLKITPTEVLGLLRTAPQLEEFRLGCGYQQEGHLYWSNDMWFAHVGLTEPVTMAHLRILEFTEEIYRASDTAWVLQRLRLPRAQLVRVVCSGSEAPDIFGHLPHTLADSLPALRSLVGLRVVAADYSFGIEGWTADRAHRFIVRCNMTDLCDSYDTEVSSVLDGLERFVDRIHSPDGPSTLELGGASLFTERAQWAALLRPEVSGGVDGSAA